MLHRNTNGATPGGKYCQTAVCLAQPLAVRTAVPALNTTRSNRLLRHNIAPAPFNSSETHTVQQELSPNSQMMAHSVHCTAKVAMQLRDAALASFAC